jgi:hypothetical protein
MPDGTTAPIMALKPGQKTPPAAPSRPRANAAVTGVEANASMTLPSIWAVMPARMIRRAPSRSMSAPAGPTTAIPTMAGTASRLPAVSMVNLPSRGRSFQNDASEGRSRAGAVMGTIIADIADSPQTVYDLVARFGPVGRVVGKPTGVNG